MAVSTQLSAISLKPKKNRPSCPGFHRVGFAHRMCGKSCDPRKPHDVVENEDHGPSGGAVQLIPEPKNRYQMLPQWGFAHYFLERT